MMEAGEPFAQTSGHQLMLVLSAELLDTVMSVSDYTVQLQLLVSHMIFIKIVKKRTKTR